MEKKIVKTKSYKIEVIDYDDDSQEIKRTNEGFHTYEFIGLLSVITELNKSILVDNMKQSMITIEKGNPKI